MNVQATWERVQRFFDVDGDCVMFFFTVAVVYKLLHGGVTAPDAAVYASAVGVFGYSKAKS